MSNENKKIFIFARKTLDIYVRIWYNIGGRRCKTLSRRQKNRGNEPSTDKEIELITAIIAFLTAIISLLDTLLER